MPPIVALVSMPFHLCVMPPIGLGLLSATLKRHGIETRVYNFNLALMPLLSRDLREAAALHDEISSLWDFLPGEWLFSPRVSAARDAEYLGQLAQSIPGRRNLIDALGALRPDIGRFVSRCAELLVAGNHDIIGFTSSFMQTQPSIAVARAVRQRRPDSRILFGGANAFGDMGAAILDQWPEIDVVSHGEADTIIVDLVRALRGEGVPLESVRGITYRRDGRMVEQATGGAAPVLDELPVPDYSDYFRDLASVEQVWQQKTGLPHYIPIETARGCWWGAKSHCTFCGLNADRMAFRSKSPDVAVREFETLYRRHGLPSFFVVDNIIDHKYFDTALKDLARHTPQFLIHYELKSNLRRQHVEALDAAGVRKVQPGIESLSTPVLRLMRKGVSAIQNIQTLKWLTEFEMRTSWFILYGFPKETLEPYTQMAALLPRLFHLTPPADLAPVCVERFSPYHSRPEEFGIEITGPTRWYGLAFPDVPVLQQARIAYRFDYVEPGRPPEITPFTETVLADLVDRWIRS